MVITFSWEEEILLILLTSIFFRSHVLWLPQGLPSLLWPLAALHSMFLLIAVSLKHKHFFLQKSLDFHETSRKYKLVELSFLLKRHASAYHKPTYSCSVQSMKPSLWLWTPKPSPVLALHSAFCMTSQGSWEYRLSIPPKTPFSSMHMPWLSLDSSLPSLGILSNSFLIQILAILNDLLGVWLSSHFSFSPLYNVIHAHLLFLFLLLGFFVLFCFCFVLDGLCLLGRALSVQMRNFHLNYTCICVCVKKPIIQLSPYFIFI